MTRERTLDSLDIAESARVVEIDGTGALAVRLAELGFVPGTLVRLVKRAPFGDPLQLELRGYHLSLRRAEAARIRVA
ncbi:MAG TPA: ferrous iron transport protein A [Nannocystaceae bacterium]|nr:ferrous iron transport protein A [Nannocystaceae bacterium]